MANLGAIFNTRNFEVMDSEITPSIMANLEKKYSEGQLEDDAAFFEGEMAGLSFWLGLLMDSLHECCPEYQPLLNFSFSRGKTSRGDYSITINKKPYTGTMQNLARAYLAYDKMETAFEYAINLCRCYDECIEEFEKLVSEHRDHNIRIERQRPWIRITMPSPDYTLQQMSFEVPANNYYLELLRKQLVVLESRHKSGSLL